LEEIVMQEVIDTYAAELIDDNLEDLVVFVMEPKDEHADIV
jgi:hypothetical protein